MQARVSISLIIYASVGVWFSALLILGVPISSDLFKPFGITIGVVTLLSVAFTQRIWRFPWLRRWLVQTPYVGGTWRARLRSTYKKKGSLPVDKTVYVVIRQNLNSMSFRLYTERAKSTSLSESIVSDGADLFRLAIAYQSTPDVQARATGESHIHFGSALFTHIDYDSEVLEGHYWTDRKTNGSLVLLERRKVTVSTFEEAENLFKFPAKIGWVNVLSNWISVRTAPLLRPLSKIFSK